MNRFAQLCVFALMLAIAAWAGRSYLDRRPVRPADGVLVSAPPQFGVVDWHPEYEPFPGNSQIIVAGTIDVTGRVLAITRYGGHDRGITQDVVLGWGKMSDNRVLDHLQVKQADHDYQIILDPVAPITLADAFASSSNLTLVQRWSAYADVDASYAMKEGDIVRIVGWTMKVKDANGQVRSGGSASGTNHVQSVAIVDPAKLQINDTKLFGNWDPEADMVAH